MVVVAPARQRHVISENERLAATAATNLVDDDLRHDLLVVKPAAEPHRFAETGDVTQPRVQRAADERCAIGVDLQESVVLGTNAAPNALAENLG